MELRGKEPVEQVLRLGDWVQRSRASLPESLAGVHTYHFFLRVLGIKLRSLCLHSKHLIDRSLSAVLARIFTARFVLITRGSNTMITKGLLVRKLGFVLKKPDSIDPFLVMR